MSHLVIYDRDGANQFERFAAIEEAIALVERLRNEGNESVRLYRLEEVQFEVKAYYRVEVGPSAPPAVAAPRDPEFEASAPPAERPAPEPMMIESIPVGAEDGGPAVVVSPESSATTREDFAVTSSMGGARRGLFGR